MSKVFYPESSILIKATGHGDDVEYKVSYGTEIWEKKSVKVFKVQMVYEGQVSGRRSPSYLFGTDDYLRVHEAMLSLIKEANEEGN